MDDDVARLILFIIAACFVVVGLGIGLFGAVFYFAERLILHMLI